MAPGACGHEVTVNDDVFIGVDGAHVLDVAEQVVMGNHSPALDQCRRRGHEPNTVADNALKDALLRESSFKELGCRRKFMMSSV
jgi:hypothetical protein